jgi:hypothetical protein
MLENLLGKGHTMSIDIAQLDQRLSSVEVALPQLQKKLGMPPGASNWVEQISGSLADIPDEDYQVFLECCQAVRNGAGSGKD